MEIERSFDPNGIGVKGSLFGLPFTPEDAQVVVIPVPWDVTVSYGAGTIQGPQCILEASSQVDLAQLDISDAWKLGVAMTPIPELWESLGRELREESARYLSWLESGSSESERDEMQSLLSKINGHCAQLMKYVRQETNFWQAQDKLTVLLGGDHSTVLGHIQACAERFGQFGILQIDAHMDLREKYEGFDFSHASIMTNVLKIEEVRKLVQVGIRDFCDEELDRMRDLGGRVVTFFDQQRKAEQFEGKAWHEQWGEVISNLPDQVYISFDIDGLDPKLCPDTGTPVPGGFELEEVMYLIKQVVKSGRKIIGVDLCEVAPGKNDYNGNVGARALYRMTNLIAVSHGLLKLDD